MTDDPAFNVLMEMADAHKRGALALWTIYDKPSDHPEGCIARMHETPGGPTSTTLKGDLEDIRRLFERIGLIKLTRNPEDEREIVETWL